GRGAGPGGRPRRPGAVDGPAAGRAGSPGPGHGYAADCRPPVCRGVHGEEAHQRDPGETGPGRPHPGGAVRRGPGAGGCVGTSTCPRLRSGGVKGMVMRIRGRWRRGPWPAVLAVAATALVLGVQAYSRADVSLSSHVTVVAGEEAATHSLPAVGTSAPGVPSE